MGHPRPRWKEVARIGEAQNPGPEQSPSCVPPQRLRYVSHPAAAAISYPTPGRAGFADYIAPGYAGSGGSSTAELQRGLAIETANTTGWAALRARLEATEADVLLGQETWVTQSLLAEASTWALKRGWKSIWAPANATAAGGTSAGVAIFAREWLGLHFPDHGGHIWSPARAVAAVLEAPGHRPIIVASCYLISGVGAGQGNLEVLADIGRGLKSVGDGWQAVIGGDMNMSPEELVATKFDRSAGASIFYPPTARGTYRTSAVQSMIDYFMVTDQLAAAVERVDTVEASGLKSHVPVMLRFKPRVTALRALHLRSPPPLEFERVYGPLPPPPSWASAKEAAEAALAIARGHGGDVDDALEAAYGAWVNTAERELEDFAGKQVKKAGLRARAPNITWRSVVPERPPARSYPEEATVCWLRGVLMEIQRIGTHARAGATRARAAGSGADSGGGGGPRGAASGGDEDDGADAMHDAPAAAEAGPADEAGTHVPMAVRRNPVTVEHCVRLVDEIDGSLARHFAADGAPEHVIAYHRRLRQLIERARHALDGEGLSARVTAAYEGGPVGHQSRVPPAQWTDVADELMIACQKEAAALREELDEAMKKCESSRRAEDTAKWRDWVQDGIDSGAAHAHAFCRAPVAWTPTVTAPEEGTAFVSTPEAQLQAERDKYRTLWRPAEGPIRYRWDSTDELPLLQPDDLRAAGKTFKRRTATTYDGLHPRQVAHLGDEGLEVLGILLQAIEVAGAWPRQVSLVTTALLPKAKGGFRPIGLLPAIYRVWAKARRPWTDRWEDAHSRAYLSAARGNGPVDAMWRLSARQEAGAADGLHAAVIAEDMQSFFETIGRERLAEEAAALGFPMPVLRAALAAYAMPRMITLQGRVSRQMVPTRGVIAGCSIAMALTKVFYLRAFDKLVNKVPKDVHLDAFVDDLTLSATGDSRSVILDVTKAHDELKAIVSDELGCSFANGKTAIMASSKAIAAAVARHVGVEDGGTAPQCLLGIDNLAGGVRARLGRKSRKGARLKAAMARRGRLARLKRAAGRKSNRIYRAGLQPAATFDSPIWGIDNDEAVKIRRLAATVMSPKARGRSLEMVHLWYDTPTADPETAPVVQAARMIWKAVTSPKEAQQRGSSIADIRRQWEAAHRAFQPLVDAWFAAAGQDGTIPRKLARQLWGKVQGPLGAAALTLARLGWRFTAPFEITDGRGTSTTLTKTSPALVRDLMRGAVRRMFERRVAARFQREDPAFTGRRACLDVAIAAAKPGRRVTPAQAGAFKAAACGALMTMQRAMKLGYAVDGLCPLCRAARDTIYHRVYACSKTEAAVRLVVPAWFWEESQRAAGNKVFWTTAVLPHPADVAPQPRDDLYMQVEVAEHRERADAEALAAAREAGLQEDGTDHRDVHQRAQLGGKVYFDGSCKPSPIRDVARAACAIVEVDSRGQLVRSLEAVVPRHLPQTAQCAEYLAMTLGYEYVRRAAEFTGDCLGVVRAMGGAARRALAPAARYAGLVLHTYKNPERRRLVHTVRWTKAHRAETGREGPAELCDIRANALADGLAKEAVGLHPALGADVEASIDYAVKRAPFIVRAVAAALELFPPAPRDMERVPRPTDEQQARQRKRHLWQYSAGAWRCAVCRDWLNAAAVPRYRDMQTCRGRTVDDDAPRMAAAGHTLCRAASCLPFTMCTSCGAWGNRRTRKLAGSCGAPTPAGAQAIKRVADGWHPALRKDGRGRDLPRDRATFTHAYDPIAGAWRPLGGGRAPVAPADAAAAEETIAATVPVAGGDGCDDGPAPPSDYDTADLGHDADVYHADGMELIEGGCESEEDVFGHGGGLDLEDAPPPPVTVAQRSAERRGEDQPTASDSVAIHQAAREAGPARESAADRISALRKRVRDRLAAATDGARGGTISPPRDPRPSEEHVARRDAAPEARGQADGDTALVVSAETNSTGDESKRRRRNGTGDEEAPAGYRDRGQLLAVLRASPQPPPAADVRRGSSELPAARGRGRSPRLDRREDGPVRGAAEPRRPPCQTFAAGGPPGSDPSRGGRDGLGHPDAHDDPVERFALCRLRRGLGDRLEGDDEGAAHKRRRLRGGHWRELPITARHPSRGGNRGGPLGDAHSMNGMVKVVDRLYGAAGSGGDGEGSSWDGIGGAIAPATSSACSTASPSRRPRYSSPRHRGRDAQLRPRREAGGDRCGDGGTLASSGRTAGLITELPSIEGEASGSATGTDAAWSRGETRAHGGSPAPPRAGALDRGACEYSAATAATAAASEAPPTTPLPRFTRMVRRRIVGKQRSTVSFRDDAPPAGGNSVPPADAPLPASLHPVFAAARSWDAAEGSPPDCEP